MASEIGNALTPHRLQRTGDRAGAAMAALGMLGVLAAFLLFSMPRIFPPHAGHEMLLRLLPQPREKPAQVIDARGAPKRAPLPAPSPQPTPQAEQAGPSQAPAQPPGALQSLGRALFNCAPEKLATLPPSQRADCPRLLLPPPPEAKHDGSDIATPPYKSKNQALWDEEMARKNTPPHLPGGGGSVFSTILGAATTLLTDPGAFLDKRSYTTPPPTPTTQQPLTRADAVDQAMRSTPPCPMTLSDHERTACQANVAASGEVGTSSSPPPRGHLHASDADVQAALAAASRRHGIVPPAALTSRGQGESADEKKPVGVGPAGPDPDPGAAGQSR